MHYIEKAKKFNLDIYKVVFSGVVVAEFLSEAAATSYLLANRYRINATEIAALKDKQRLLRDKLLNHRHHLPPSAYKTINGASAKNTTPKARTADDSEMAPLSVNPREKETP